MNTLSVTPVQLSSTGATIQSDAEGLDAAANGIGGIGGVSEPPHTAHAVQQLSSAWKGGVTRMQDDLKALGLGLEAASTLYTHTDASAMEAS